MHYQPEEETSSGGDQLVSNRADVYTEKVIEHLYLFNPTFFGKLHGLISLVLK